MTPRTAGNDAERRQTVGHGLHRLVGFHRIAGQGVNLFFHQRFDLMRAGIADEDQPHIVGDEMQHAFILENCRIGLENRRVLRRIDMAFDFRLRLGLDLVHQIEQQPDDIEIVLVLRRLVGEGLKGGLAGVLDGRHRVGDDENTDGGTADDDEFPGLHQHVDMPAHGHEAAQKTANVTTNPMAMVTMFPRIP